MKLILFISDKKVKTFPLSYCLNSNITINKAIKPAIELMKIENKEKMAGKFWEIFLYAKSKMK